MSALAPAPDYAGRGNIDTIPVPATQPNFTYHVYAQKHAEQTGAGGRQRTRASCMYVT